MNRRILLAATAAIAFTAVVQAQDISFWYRHSISGIGGPGQAAPANQPPAISDLAAGMSADPGLSVRPFGLISVTDPNASDLLTATVVIDVSVAGSVADIGGFVPQGGGTYVLVGTPTTVTTTLRNFVFTPFTGRLPPGGTEDVQFSLQVADAAGASDIGAVTLTVSEPPNDAPVIVGLSSGLAIEVGETIAPFGSASVGDPENDTVTLTVTLDDAAKGSFTTLAGFVDGGGGIYTVAAAPGIATTALRGLVFTPTAGRLTPGASQAVQFTIEAQDALGSSVSSSSSITVSAPPNDPPVIAGVPTGLTIKVDDTIAPFSAVSISDSEDDTVTVTVTLDDTATGTFSTLGGFASQGSGVYTLSAAPATATTSLKGLVFTPAEGRLDPDESESVEFALSAADEFGADTATVALTVTAPGAPADACDGSPSVGTVCADGAVYAGTVGGNKIFAAPTDESTDIQWRYTLYTDIIGSNSKSDGLANTNTFVANSISNYPAAQACRNRGVEWYLPSEDELQKLYDNRTKIGNFAPDGTRYYWSSTSVDTVNARSLFFYNSPMWSSRAKNIFTPIRCVRR